MSALIFPLDLASHGMLSDLLRDMDIKDDFMIRSAHPVLCAASLAAQYSNMECFNNCSQTPSPASATA